MPDKENSTLHRHMQMLREELAKMAGTVEKTLYLATESIMTRDPEKAHQVIRGDRVIDKMQNDIERQCFTLMATQQPVAIDLRFLTGTIMICLFLERMGDQAVNLGQRALAVTRLARSEPPATLRTMADIAREMTKDCMDAVARDDVRLAQQVLQRDDELDDLCREFLEEQVTWMTGERRIIRRGVEYILASRHLERIGDEATNIAEQVIFLVEGRVIRHVKGLPEP